MTARARGQKPNSVATARRRSRRIWLIALALPVLAFVPFLTQFMAAEVDEIEAIVRKAGFEPVNPPSRLRGPGALYEIDGTSYRTACPVDPAAIAGKLRKSPTLDRVRQRLEKGGFSLDGDFVSMLNAKLGATHVQSITYRLTDAVIIEIAEADLAEIQETLLQQKHCVSVVDSLLESKKHVCRGYAALSATTSYKIETDSTLDAQTRLHVATAVKQHLEEQTGSQIHIHRSDELHGQDLFFGIQLSHLCILSGTATGASVRPSPPVRS